MYRINLLGLVLLALMVMLAGCNQNTEEVDYTFSGEVIAFPDAIADYVIRAEDGQSYEPVELDERYQGEGIRVRVEAVEEPALTVAEIGPTIRIVAIEEL